MNPAIKAMTARPPTTPNTIATVGLVVPLAGNALLVVLVFSARLVVLDDDTDDDAAAEKVVVVGRL